ncbi:HAD-IA family hydrolase [Agaribacter flavus]|uniref:HAD-IA family hydrolase n=1 Tax=Agaribacter flavus TaxID=1902781 RepID=A0ABV7FSH4_9ALTE
MSSQIGNKALDIKYSHIIFDWDGTLMDSSAKIVSCMKQAAIKSNLDVPSDKAIQNIIGISLIPAIQQLFDVDIKAANTIAGHYKESFIRSDSIPCPLFEEVYDTLAELQDDFVLGVATGKARKGLERAWENSSSALFFDASRCADEAKSKPSPDMLLQLLDVWQVKADKVLMVGDTVYDMQMAEAIGMHRLAVSYGVHDKTRLAKHNPIGIINSFSEIKQYLGY